MFEGITISNIFSAVTALLTLILAFLTWKTVRQIEKQNIFIQKQGLLAAAAQNPILKIVKFSIKRNQIKIVIENVGNGNAHRIGVFSYFALASPLISGYDKKNRTLVHFNYNPKKLVDLTDKNKRKVASNGYVNFNLASKQPIIIPPKAKVTLIFNPSFYFRYEGGLLAGGRVVNMSQLTEIITKNDISFVGLSFELVYKNSIEDMQEPVEIAKFIYHLKKHTSLNEAFKQHLKVGFNSLSQNEIELDLKGLDYEMYSTSKSWRNYIKGESDPLSEFMNK